MRLSVAMCTYNGALYVGEQLESILHQELKVDEIVVCDDNSNDSTINIVRDYSNKHPEVKWIIIHNSDNLGVCDNFAKAFSLCTGDIIFLSDQDDFWYPNKTRIICDWFCNNAEKEVVFTDADLIGDNGDTFLNGKTLFTSIGITPSVSSQLKDGWYPELFAYENCATGATMAFRRTILREMTVSSSCNNKYNLPLHDIQLVYHALGKGTLGHINKVLMGYRIHREQVCGLGGEDKIKVKNKKIYEARYGLMVTTDITDALLNRMVFLGERRNFMSSRFRNKIYTHLFKYYKVYKRKWYKPFFYDVFCSCKESV